VLQNYEPAIEKLFSKVLSQTKRKEVQPDDVLDAAVAFITAEGRHGKLTSLCAPPRHDLAGLSIEMVYLRTWAMSPNLSSNGRAEARLST
jgi:predicted RNase H-like nuclease